MNVTKSKLVRSPAFKRSSRSSIPDPPSFFRFLCFLLTSVLCSLTSVVGVQQAWVAKYSNGSNTISRAVAIALDKDGNIYVAGHSTRTNAAVDYDYLALKYSPLGALVWANGFGASGVNETNRGLAVGPEGEAILTGSGGTVKYHSSGLLAWSAPYAGSDIQVDTNGNVYVSGFQTDAFATVKISPNGSNLWLRIWNPSQWDDVAQKMALDTGGNVYVSGLATFRCDQSGCLRELRTLKYDAAGSLLWNIIVYEGYYSSLSQYNAAMCDLQGNLYLAMNVREAIGGSYPWATRKLLANGSHSWSRVLSGTYFGPGVKAMVVDSAACAHYTGTIGSGYETFKLSAEGTNIWNSRYAPGLGFHQANAIALDAGDNVYITGQSAGSGTGNDYATIKYGTNGQQLWVQRYTETGNSDDQAHAIAVNADGDVYVTGFSNPSPGTYEITTIKYVELSPIQKKTNGNILLCFCGTPGSNYVIEACSGLTNWVTIGTSTCSPSGLYTFEDTNAPAFGQRFYRTKQE